MLVLIRYALTHVLRYALVIYKHSIRSDCSSVHTPCLDNVPPSKACVKQVFGLSQFSPNHNVRTLPVYIRSNHYAVGSTFKPKRFGISLQTNHLSQRNIFWAPLLNAPIQFALTHLGCFASPHKMVKGGALEFGSNNSLTLE